MEAPQEDELLEELHGLHPGWYKVPVAGPYDWEEALYILDLPHYEAGMLVLYKVWDRILDEEPRKDWYYLKLFHIDQDGIQASFFAHRLPYLLDKIELELRSNPQFRCFRLFQQIDIFQDHL